jgi:LytS/YehU family sensor histidine kinase
LFLRSNVEEPLAELRELGHSAADEEEYLNKASAIIAVFLSSDMQQVREAPADLVAPVAVLDAARWGVPPWVQAIVPLRFARGDAKALLLGGRKGGRRYLSEDFTILARLAAAVVEHVEQLRESQMQALVTQAELRALQAQINPHFFFNALNTLYGTIARENAEARQLVLNLADLFRYFLHSDRTFIQVAEELKIVRSYLAIEELRLGSKFKAYLDVDDDTLTASIPVLSIQPLVENAVKHGIAARSGEGFVRLSVHVEGQGIAVAVTNSGEWTRHDQVELSAGIGLANVRRRLELCFGEASHVEVTSGDGITTVRFRVPVAASLETAHAWD